MLPPPTANIWVRQLRPDYLTPSPHLIAATGGRRRADPVGPGRIALSRHQGAIILALGERKRKGKRSMKVIADDHPVSPIGHTASDLQDLRIEALRLIGYGISLLALAILGLAVVDESARDPVVWLVVLPLLGAAGSTRLSHSSRVLIPSLAMIAGLGLSSLAASLAFPGSGAVYSLPLLSIVANLLLGERSSFVVAGVTTGAIVAMSQWSPAAVPSSNLGILLLLAWLACLLSWLATRPTMTALDWAWRSYLLALQRSEELRDRQGELERLAKSLNETCTRLEQMNEELERARRAALEARQLKAEFAAMISHELRTPLNLVVGFSEMISEPRGLPGPPLPERYQAIVAAIQRNANHLARLVDDVLDLSQIEAQRMALDKRWTALRPIVDDAVEAIASLFEHVGLRLTVDIPSNLPLLQADANRVRQILINLLNNAARFTDQGGVTIRAAYDGREITVAVSDTGVGIAPEDIPYVFQEFRQIFPLGRRRGGNGLGLAVCKCFVEMHGGSIWVESQLDQGSTFSFTLPTCTNIVSTPLSLAPVPRIGAVRTIALLGREVEAAKLFRRYLDGYEVILARNIAELRKLAAEHSLHALVISDASAVDRWNREQDPSSRLRTLPTITCELNTSTPQRLAKEFGVGAYLVKPVSREDLLTAVRRVGKGAREILLIEDDPEMASLLKGLLLARSRRRRIRHAEDGTAALRLLRECRPDLVILDRLIPGVSGDEVLQHMKADAELREVPAIVISAKTVNEGAIRADRFVLDRLDGLTVGEVMACLRQNLDVLLPSGRSDSDAVPTGEPAA